MRVNVAVGVKVLVGVFVNVLVGTFVKVEVGVGVGAHSAPELAPGTWLGRMFVATVPAAPAVAPNAACAVVVVPFAPPETSEVVGPLESRITPPPPPPPGPW